MLFNGGDIFEAKYPIDLVRENRAINFNFNVEIDNLEEISDLTPEFFDNLNKNPKSICLKNEEFKLDSEPISKHCSCHTCSTVNKSYIYHLIDCDELNAEILLTLHNIK